MTDSKVKLSISATLFLVSIIAFQEPKMFLNSKNARKWSYYIGEDRTKKLIKYVGSPVLILLSLAILFDFLPKK